MDNATDPTDAPADASDARPNRGWRGTPELWLDAAQAALVEGGVEQVRVLPLAAKLGLSRTSFYWHFADREALLQALIARWQASNTGTLIARTRAPAATITEAMLNIIDGWIAPGQFDAGLELAMRNWSQGAPELARLLARADAERIAALTALFGRFGFAPDQADTRARAIYLTQIGYIAMRSDETLAERLRRVPAYAETFSGQPPSAAELAAFMARHPLPGV